MKLVRVIAVAAFAFAGTSASAQTPYVGASLFGDVVRTTHTETAGGRGTTGGGEALGFALRAGTGLGSVWGVEVEVARPASIEDEGVPGGIPIPALTFFGLEELPSGSAAIFPPIIVGFRSSQRHTTLSAIAWAEQVFSARVSLVYLAGIGFVRSQHEFSASYSPLAGVAPTIFPPFASETVGYGVGPLAGFEARLGLTDRAQLVPGVRLHAIADTWLVRPSIGINWSF
jgi:hypothetical protein